MSICLMYITNNPIVAGIAQDAGVDRIFLDMEYIGKAERQCGLDTVLCSHTIEDIAAVRIRSVSVESQEMGKGTDILRTI